VFSNQYTNLLIAIMCLLASTSIVFASGTGDPLRPPGYATRNGNSGTSAPRKPTWWVNEILFSGGRRVAIVNNVAVVVGDHVNGAKVVDIKPGLVVLKYKSGLLYARLHTLLVKKQSLKKQID